MKILIICVCCFLGIPFVLAQNQQKNPDWNEKIDFSWAEGKVIFDKEFEKPLFDKEFIKKFEFQSSGNSLPLHRGKMHSQNYIETKMDSLIKSLHDLALDGKVIGNEGIKEKDLKKSYTIDFSEMLNIRDFMEHVKELHDYHESIGGEARSSDEDIIDVLFKDYMKASRTENKENENKKKNDLIDFLGRFVKDFSTKGNNFGIEEKGDDSDVK